MRSDSWLINLEETPNRTAAPAAILLILAGKVSCLVTCLVPAAQPEGLVPRGPAGGVLVGRGKGHESLETMKVILVTIDVDIIKGPFKGPMTLNNG